MSEKTLGELACIAYYKVIGNGRPLPGWAATSVDAHAWQAAADAIAAPLLARIAELEGEVERWKEYLNTRAYDLENKEFNSWWAVARWELNGFTPDRHFAKRCYEAAEVHAYQRGVAEERERCAKIAEIGCPTSEEEAVKRYGANWRAEAIRNPK